jgi:hypothetical protein
MRPLVRDLVAALLGTSDQAVANARSASTDLARRRVEREEVELFLAGLPERRARRDTA